MKVRSTRKKLWACIVFLSLSILGLWAQTGSSGIKSCEELKAEIEAKLKAKGVQGYSLEIVPADQVKDQKVIGSCEGGKKKITYERK